MPENTYRSPDTPLTYKVLLILTTLSSILFCWLYVTKPVEVVVANDSDTKSAESSETPAESDTPDLVADPQPVKSQQTATQNPTDFLAPSEENLPNTSNQRPTTVEPTSPTSRTNPISLANSASTKGSAQFEETNDRIQHVISAHKNDKSERIILEVPVIYETRGLRLGPEQAEEARRILRALKSYRALVAKLHQDGKNISKAWELLLVNSQPIDALRADSPSLPQNTKAILGAPTEKSSATISIDSDR